jgi:5'-nucleotidase
MRILLTNDDGIYSPGLLALAGALRKAGHRVVVVAPASNQSAVSHSITFITRPCKLAEIDKDTWSCGGTPADCVVIALMGGLPELFTLPHSPPDMIISGINRGANLGTDIVYSGTAAAARQGALFSVPSVALSLVEGDEWNWDMAAGFAVERLDEIMAYWKPDTFINVNIPNRREKPLALVHAFPSFRYYNDRIDIYHAPDGCRYCFVNAGEMTAKTGPGSDYEAVEGNNASLSEVFIHPLLLEAVKEREGDDDGKPVK